jgi:hypothetical protein
MDPAGQLGSRALKRAGTSFRSRNFSGDDAFQILTHSREMRHG